MGSIRYTAPDPEGESHGLYDHEGFIGSLLDDGSVVGSWTAELDPHIVGFRSACDCGWHGATTLPRTDWDQPAHLGAANLGESSELELEWVDHTDPLLAELAREHGVVSIEEASRALAPVQQFTSEAGALVEQALRACDQLETAGDVAEIRRYLTDAGRALGRAEVLSYPVRQNVGPLILERIASEATTGWGRWEVRDQEGALIGRVGEEREWTGTGYGPPTYTAAHNPTGADWAARWRTEGHDTPRLALAALVAHLERHPDDQPR